MVKTEIYPITCENNLVRTSVVKKVQNPIEPAIKATIN